MSALLAQPGVVTVSLPFAGMVTLASRCVLASGVGGSGAGPPTATGGPAGAAGAAGAGVAAACCVGVRGIVVELTREGESVVHAVRPIDWPVELGPMRRSLALAPSVST